MCLLTKKQSVLILLLIKKGKISNVKEYNFIEKAIVYIEINLNVSFEK